MANGKQIFQTVSDRKLSMSIPSLKEGQNFVHSWTVYHAFFWLLCCHQVSCAPQVFVYSYSDFRSFCKLLWGLVQFSWADQTFVRATDCSAIKFRFPFVHQILECSCSFFRAYVHLTLCFHFQTLVWLPGFVRSPDFCEFMFRLLYCALKFRFYTFKHSKLQQHINITRMTPQKCVHLRSGHNCFHLGTHPV